MTREAASARWRAFALSLLPFADATSAQVPLSRLMRLALFQVSTGAAAVLLTGALNRVMIVELGAPAALVAAMVALPLVFAPFRALLGFRSDHHRSALGWRRGPYIWFGSLLQFGGFAILPFALIVLSGDTTGPVWHGYAAAALGFLLVGAGMHTVQTAGLALATDLCPEAARPRVVAALYAMLLAGMLLASLVFGALLSPFSQIRLIQVLQGAALLLFVCNMLALWKQEARDPSRTALDTPPADFKASWRALAQRPGLTRLLVAVGLGSAGFSMQDVLLEPFGGEVLGLSVSGTTMLTALWASGALAGFLMSARVLSRGADPYRLAGVGALIGAAAFALVILAAPMQSGLVFAGGVAGVGLGGGFFAVGTLTAAMAFGAEEGAGLALGAWGAVQATCAGVAIALGGAARDVGALFAASSGFGGAAFGYAFAYHLEILLLFAALAVIGPLARHARAEAGPVKFGLSEFPT